MWFGGGFVGGPEDQCLDTLYETRFISTCPPLKKLQNKGAELQTDTLLPQIPVAGDAEFFGLSSVSYVFFVV